MISFRKYLLILELELRHINDTLTFVAYQNSHRTGDGLTAVAVHSMIDEVQQPYHEQVYRRIMY